MATNPTPTSGARPSGARAVSTPSPVPVPPVPTPAAAALAPASPAAETEAIKPPVVAVPKPKENDLVQITMVVDIEVPPRFGSYDFGRELGVNKLSKGATYRVPRAHAMVLLDRKAVMVAG